MIKIYKNRNNEQFNKVKYWLDRYHLDYKVITQTGLLYEDVKHILYLSDKGFEEVLVSKCKSPKTYENLPNHLFEMSVNELIQFILSYQQILKSPIVFDEGKLLIGYNVDEIRVFIPKVRQFTF